MARSRWKQDVEPAPALRIDMCGSWAEAAPRWDRLSRSGDATPFQRTAWVDAWYRHCAGRDVEPLVVFLADAATGDDLMGLALVRKREGLRRVIAFADGGLTDYNAPVLGQPCLAGLDGDTLWRALRAALPPADLLRFEKMPVAIGERPNPLASLPGVRRSRFNGHVLPIAAGWETWIGQRGKHFRKEVLRCRRVFERNPDAAFRRYGPGAEAERAYADLRALQRARIAELGLPYCLDDEPAAGLYDTVVREGLRDGTAVLTALTVGEEVVAGLVGLCDGRRLALTRLATAGSRWSRLSPGRTLIERTIEALHQEGVDTFDFTIGDYPYKKHLGACPLAMVERRAALTPLGWGEVGHVALRGWARRQPAVHRLVTRWRERRRARA